MVLLKYSSFDSTVLLKGTAYDIAVALRDAQVKSLSQTRSGGSFNYPFGMSFSPATTTYTAFLFKDTDPSHTPNFGSSSEVLQKFVTGRTMQVSDICVIVGGSEDCLTPTRLDISFRRPEFKSLFYVGGYSTQPTVESAKIIVNSTNASTETFWIVINRLGQITVSKGTP